jgi:hypothetical protein
MRVLTLAIVLSLTWTLTPSLSRAQCTTPVPAGTISGEEWTAAGSPYCIDGDVTVNSLAIKPGVRVEFSGDYLFTVEGVLEATRLPVLGRMCRWLAGHLDRGCCVGRTRSFRR